MIDAFMTVYGKPKDGPPPDGEPTDFKCPRCQGAMVATRMRSETIEAVVDISVGPPPKHRKKRIRKKLLKRYEERRQAARLAVDFMRAMAKPSFVCIACRFTEGFYGAVARNIFQIEPLPPGAMPVYDRDVDVAKIVTEPR